MSGKIQVPINKKPEKPTSGKTLVTASTHGNKEADVVVQGKKVTEHAGGKPRKYLLIPYDAIDETKTMAGLAATWEFHG